ncbi:hypothetical protein L3Y34_016306 [Caenorhabditis briggsae]|uniref:Uncharacterized protein n=1 Tax=Caenorhabditis briggsae TaxID=6238 RepID=A0AAE9J0B7_CAEBR|nr:hypothetical protein L3Y34_016306 [Caenorhabditis briggsae]
MNQILKYGSIDKIPFYNCSAHTSQEWSDLYGVSHPILGLLDVIFGVTVIILYIPIIVVMFQSEFYKMSCFKIMICLAIVDMSALVINSIITGILAIRGAVWCTCPKFNYIVGMIVLGLWCSSCIIVLILVSNRLLELSEHKLSKMFTGNRPFLIMLAPFLYGLYFAVFTNPVGFNSKYYTWLFNPMISDIKTDKYINISHAVNNVAIVAITCILYVWLYLEVREKLKAIGWKDRKNDLGFQILVQSAMICSINFVASIIFVVMNIVELPIWIIIVAQKMWQLIHGAPVFIYLTLNRTIRKGFIKLFQEIKKVYHIPHSTTVSPQS